MKRDSMLLLFAVMAVFLSACTTCPDNQGNYVQLEGADFDTLYNEILFLPSNITEEGDPRYYDRGRNICQWCLPIDIARSETIYVLQGDTRTDTITLTYNVALHYRDDNCGYQTAANNVQVISTFTDHDLIILDNELNTFRLWVEL